METKDSVRYWAGVVGAVAVVAGILAVVVMVRMPAPKKTAQQTHATKTSPPQTAAKPVVTTQKPQPQAKAVAAAKPAAAPSAKTAPANMLTDAEKKTSEELYIEQKKLDTDTARVMAAAPDGKRRVAEMIAKQFSVPEKLVTDLRGRKLSWGEVTATLAASQQLMKHDKLSRQQAVDKILAARKSGQGWATLAKGFGLKVADVLSDVKKTDKQVAKMVLVKASR